MGGGHPAPSKLPFDALADAERTLRIELVSDIGHGRVLSGPP